MPLIAVGCKKQASEEFTEVRVLENLGSARKNKGWGPLLYHMTDIEQVCLTADGSKLISIEKNPERTMCVWDLSRIKKGTPTTGTCLRSRKGHRRLVINLIRTPE